MFKNHNAAAVDDGDMLDQAKCFTESLLILTVTWQGSDIRLLFNFIIHIILSSKWRNRWTQREKLKPKFEPRESESWVHTFSRYSALLMKTFLLTKQRTTLVFPSREVSLFGCPSFHPVVHMTLIPFSMNLSWRRLQNLVIHIMKVCRGQKLKWMTVSIIWVLKFGPHSDMPAQHIPICEVQTLILKPWWLPSDQLLTVSAMSTWGTVCGFQSWLLD